MSKASLVQRLCAPRSSTSKAPSIFIFIYICRTCSPVFISVVLTTVSSHPVPKARPLQVVSPRMMASATEAQAAQMHQQAAEAEYSKHVSALEQQIENRLLAIAGNRRFSRAGVSATGFQVVEPGGEPRELFVALAAEGEPAADDVDKEVASAATDSTTSPTAPAGNKDWQTQQLQQDLVHVTQEAVSIWNSVLEAVEAVVSAPSMAAQGITKGAQSLPLPGHTSLPKDGGLLLELPVSLAKRDSDCDGFFGADRNFQQDPLGLSSVMMEESASNTDRDSVRESLPHSSGQPPPGQTSPKEPISLTERWKLERNAQSMRFPAAPMDPSGKTRVLARIVPARNKSPPRRHQATITDTPSPIKATSSFETEGNESLPLDVEGQDSRRRPSAGLLAKSDDAPRTPPTTAASLRDRIHAALKEARDSVWRV